MHRTAKRQREVETMHNQNLRLRSALQEVVQLAGKNGPPNDIDALNEIEATAKAALRYSSSPTVAPETKP